MLTLQQFQTRVDGQLLTQLTDPEGTAVDLAKVEAALADAAGMIDGYLYRLPPESQPPASAVEAHQVALTLYTLVGNRPGEEFASIAARAKVALEWLRSFGGTGDNAGSATAGGALEVASESPASLFDSASLEEFGNWASDGGEA